MFVVVGVRTRQEENDDTGAEALLVRGVDHVCSLADNFLMKSQWAELKDFLQTIVGPFVWCACGVLCC